MSNLVTKLDGAVRREVLDIRRLLTSLAKPTPWTDVTFENGWANYGSGYQTVQFRKTGDWVQVRGLGKLGTIGFVNAFVLPPGFRPPAALQFSGWYNTAATMNTVDANGAVQAVAGSNLYQWFDFAFSTT